MNQPITYNPKRGNMLKNIKIIERHNTDHKEFIDLEWRWTYAWTFYYNGIKYGNFIDNISCEDKNVELTDEIRIYMLQKMMKAIEKIVKYDKNKKIIWNKPLPITPKLT